MGYKTITTKIASARSTKSKQSTSYQYPSGNGVVLTGSSINSQTSAYLDVTTPGAARSFTAVSGGGTSTVISNIQYLDANNVVANAIAVSTTGGNILINGNGFANTSRVYVNNQLVTNTFVNSNAIIATLSANSVGNVSLAVFNSSGQSGVFSNSNVRFSGAPSWVSAAAVSSYNGVASNIALQASGDGTLTYSLKSGSGSLPSGITLSSSGYLSGTATGYTVDTVVTFTLIVADTESQEAQQSFSYTVFIGDTYFKQTSLLLSATVSNTFISDSSTNNFLITRNGDTRPSRLSPYWPGGWSGYFDGTGDYLSAPSNTAFSVGTGDFTVEAWVSFQTTPASGAHTPICQNDALSGSTNDKWYVSLYNNSGTLRLQLGQHSTSNAAYVNWTPTVYVWYNIVVERAGGTTKIFINGTEQSVTNSTVFSSTNFGQNGFVVGGMSTPYYMIGYISNFRFVKGSAVYTANFTPSTTSLTTVANTSLLTLRDAILADDSPINSTITRNGDTKLTTFSPFNTAPHTIAANTNSVYFDGTTDSLSVPASSEFAYGTGNFTVEGWIYPMSSGDQMIYAQSVGGTNYFIFNINANVPKFIFATSGGGTTITSSISAPLNSWSHVAIVREGTGTNQTKIYVNGLLGVSSTCAQDFTNTTYNPTIGAYTHGGNAYTGYVSNFRILKGTALYTANFTPATSALTTIANTSILACQANTIIDSNTTPKTITINGNPNVSLANPFGETVTTISNYTWSANSYGASAYFDGSGDYLSLPGTGLNPGTGDFTWESWIYTSAAYGTWNYLLLVDTLTTGIYIGYDTAGTLVVGQRGSGANNSVSYTLPVNQWVHLAVSRSGSTLRIFSNGVQILSGSNSINYSGTGTAYIGGGSVGNPIPAGYLSDYRFIKGTALYTGPFIPPAAPVSNVANVSLLTLQSDIGSNSAQFLDQSPNNHLITRNGNASQGTFGPLVPSTWSAYFDGSGDYLSLATSSITISGDFTWESWVYDTVVNAYGVPLGWRTGTPWQGFIVNRDNSSSNVAVNINNSGLTLTQTSATYLKNQWNHLALVRSGSIVTIFVNGSNVASGSYSSSISPGTSYWIGSDPMNNISAVQFSGYISNQRFINGTAVYTANFTPSTTTISPISNTYVLSLRGPAFTDDSGNNFTITRNGDTKIVPFGPFSPQIVTPDSYSYRFSNASDYISTTSSNLAFGSNNWTIESWIYPRFTANSGVFQVSNVQYGLTNSNLNTVALGFSSTNKAIVRVANATYTSTGTSITANAWTHLALVKSSNVSKLYINGTLDSTVGTSGSITDTVSYTGTTNIAVGGYGSTSALANAYISNFRIVSNSAVYTENFTPAVGPLSAISGTTLLTCQANTVIDASTANLTITANANVTPRSFNPFDETVTVGQAYSALADGGSVYFDSDDYLSPPDHNSFAFGTLPYTVEFWIYMDVYGSTYNRVLDLQTSNGFGIQITSAGVISITKSGAADVLVSSGSFTTKNWNHVAITRTSTSSNSTQIFLNGLSVALGTDANNWTVSGTLRINGSSALANSGWQGYLSNLRILKGTALYTSNFVPPAGPAIPTTANTALLLNFTSSGVIDSTGRNILETVADAKVTTNLKKYGTGSYYFDGTGDYMYVMGNSTELAFGTGDFTIEFWINPADATATFTIFDCRPSNTNGVYPLLYTQSSSIRYYVSTADRITGGALSTNNWTHVALARSGSSTKLFLNGTQSGSTYTDTNNYLNGANRPILGINGYDLLLPMNGYLTDLRVTKGYARYTANFTVPSEPFITK